MLLWIWAETKRQASQRGDSTRFISTGMERCGNGFPGYFTSIPHNKLLELISRRISDASLLKLIKQTLKIGISHKGSVQPTKIGVPQGSPTSPLYSNIYLNVIDRKWQEEKCPEK